MPKTTKYTTESVTLKITDYSDEILKELSEAIERGLEEVGGEAVKYAAGDCPVDTGLLRNSLTYALDGGTTKIRTYKADRGGETGSYSGSFPKNHNWFWRSSRTLFVGTNVSYARAVETNTNVEHTTGKAHFLKDAVANHSEQYKNIIETSLEAAKG